MDKQVDRLIGVAPLAGETHHRLWGGYPQMLTWERKTHPILQGNHEKPSIDGWLFIARLCQVNERKGNIWTYDMHIQQRQGQPNAMQATALQLASNHYQGARACRLQALLLCRATWMCIPTQILIAMVIEVSSATSMVTYGHNQLDIWLTSGGFQPRKQWLP